MKFKMDAEKLNQSLSSFGTIANSPIEILRGIKLKSKSKTKLNLILTNLDITIESNQDATIDKEGEILVPYKVFKEIISKLNTGLICFEVIKNKLQIKQDKIKFNLDLLNLDEYPTFENLDVYKEKGNLDTKDLKDISFAAINSMSSGRAELYSVFCDKNKLVSTDGFRLSIKKIPKIEASFIIPYPTVEILQNMGSSFKVSLSESKVMFKNKEFIVTSSFIDGEFPDYRKIIPKNSFTITTSRVSLLDALERTKISNQESVYLKISKDNLKIEGTSDKVFYAEELSIVSTIKDLKLRFNPNFLLDILQVVSLKEVNISVEDFTKPIIIKTKDMLHLFLGMEVN